MKRSLFPGLALAFALAISALAQSAAGPKLVIARLEHSIGEIRKGETAKYAFAFRNEGSADLEIKNVAPS